MPRKRSVRLAMPGSNESSFSAFANAMGAQLIAVATS